LAKTLDLRVSIASAPVVTAGHNLAAYHQYRSDCGVGARLAKPAPRFAERGAHKSFVVSGDGHKAEISCSAA
jgi:hypothetical protein